jgi:hypothetical protein
MRKSVSIPQQNLNWFDSTAVPHYQAMFRVGARHWMVIMFYERVIVLLVLVDDIFVVIFCDSSLGMQLCSLSHNSILGWIHSNGTIRNSANFFKNKWQFCAGYHGRSFFARRNFQTF